MSAHGADVFSRLARENIPCIAVRVGLKRGQPLSVQIAKELRKNTYPILRLLIKNYRRTNMDYKEFIVTPNGEVISCAFDAKPDDMTGIGYIPHWSTCPHANSFRKR